MGFFLERPLSYVIVVLLTNEIATPVYLVCHTFCVISGSGRSGNRIVVWVSFTTEFNSNTMYPSLLPQQLLEQPLSKQVISILRGNIHLCVSDIIRLEAERNYTRFILADGSQLLTCKNLSFYEPLLPESFVRVHKSHLLNRHYILRKSKTHICMRDGTEIEVSRRKRRIAKRTIN